jgi:hypothetical protein
MVLELQDRAFVAVPAPAALRWAKGGRALPVQAAYLEKLRYRIPLAKNYVNKMISGP